MGCHRRLLLLLPLVLLLLNPMLTVADLTESPQQWLQQMEVASRSIDYELFFLRLQRATTVEVKVEALRYRHAVINQQSFGQLLKLEGPRYEVLLHGGNVHYFEASPPLVSMPNSPIIDALPTVVTADFQQLQGHYNFIALGEDRVADRRCQVISIVPRDQFRYGYTLWLDIETKLLLRADLLEQAGKNLEQFRVVALNRGRSIRAALNQLVARRPLPKVAAWHGQQEKVPWQAGWLPPGFKEIFRRNQPPKNSESQVASPLFPSKFPLNFSSKLYSDGLFNFALYVHADVSDGQSSAVTMQQGQHTVYSEIHDGWEMTVVGELPLSTAKQVVQRVVFAGKK